MDVIGRMPRGRVSTWPGVIVRMSLAERPCRVGQRIYIYYIVKPNLALALWSPSIGLGGDLKSPSNKTIIAGL